MFRVHSATSNEARRGTEEEDEEDEEGRKEAMDREDGDDEGFTRFDAYFRSHVVTGSNEFEPELDECIEQNQSKQEEKKKRKMRNKKREGEYQLWEMRMSRVIECRHEQRLIAGEWPVTNDQRGESIIEWNPC
jgi:hypothetical protein